MKPSPTRTILHICLDGFLASVEETTSPELRGKPVIVRDARTQGSRVLSVNSTARRLGIIPGQLVESVMRRCPIVVCRTVRYDLVRKYSQRFFSILQRFSSQIEPRRLDEAFIDLADQNFAQESPAVYASTIQRIVQYELGLPVSLGLATTKTVAWAAARQKRPNGFTVIPRGDERAFLYPLPLWKMYSLGDRTRKFLETHGVRTIGQLAALDADWLQEQLGSFGREVLAKARGEYDEDVRFTTQPKSLSRSLRFEYSISDPAWLQATLSHLYDKAIWALAARGQHSRSVVVRVEDAGGHSRQFRRRFHGTPPPLTTFARSFNALFQQADLIRGMSITLDDLAFSPRTQSVAPWYGAHIRSALLGLQSKVGDLRSRWRVGAQLPLEYKQTIGAASAG